jgi:hypothetical protein
MSKTTFFTGQPVFSQLLSLIPRSVINRLASKHNSNRYSKKFDANAHLIAMLYAGFFQCTSLRELITGLQANATRLFHLGLTSTPRRSTLSDANKRRDVIFFQDLYHTLYSTYFGFPDSRSKNDEEALFIIDSTTIPLFSSVMEGAGVRGANGKKKGGVKAHMMIDARHDIPAFIRITAAKANDRVLLHKLPVPQGATVVFDKGYINYTQFKAWDKNGIRWITRLRNDAAFHKKMDIPLSDESIQLGVTSDQLVVLGSYVNRRTSPMIKARIIGYYDQQKERHFSFITNDLFTEPFQIAELYRRRWQIELLFKRIKQRYPLKYFLGDNPNAIQIQVWAALICDLLVRIIQNKVNKFRSKPWAYASIASMIKHHLMTYIELLEFLVNPERALIKLKRVPQQLKLFKKGAYF